MSTTQRRVGTLRLLCHWLQLEGHLGVDPTLRIEAPERPVRLPAGWNDDELERLAEAVWEERKAHARRWPALEHATFALLSTTGVRAAELCAVTEQSLRRDSGGEVVMSVIGKGNRQRIVPVPPEAITFVEAYLQERTARFGTLPAASPLLRRADGVPLTRGALRHLVDGWIARSGVPKQEGESAHGFRHTYAKGLDPLRRTGARRPGAPRPRGPQDHGHLREGHGRGRPRRGPPLPRPAGAARTHRVAGDQPTAFFTSSAMRFSSAAVREASANDVGHIEPSSRFASSLKPSVAYRVLNFEAAWKKTTTLPSLA